MHFLSLISCVSLFLLSSACMERTTSDSHERMVKADAPSEVQSSIIVGAARFENYLSLLSNKRVGLVVNQTSMVGDSHLVDTLLAKGIDVRAIFSPEHGFRGDADAGATVLDEKDTKTGLPVYSIYGQQKKPSVAQLSNLDVLVFDIQDVGVRFYTYISSMHYVMEACAENEKELLVLDRPNPNGHYVDGPVLKTGFESFVGMHPIPVVHGLTVGELAFMINGENWLKNDLLCKLTVIPVANYHHGIPYSLPVKPSPNLPNDHAIGWYPSLCLFEGTMMSLGRGTPFPFQVLGYPDPRFGEFTFTPVSTPGAASAPVLKDLLCYGVDLREDPPPNAFSLGWLIHFYKLSGNHKQFISRSRMFNLLAGTDQLQEQLRQGLSEEAIRASWQDELGAYRALRAKYLLYSD